MRAPWAWTEADLPVPPLADPALGGRDAGNHRARDRTPRVQQRGVSGRRDLGLMRIRGLTDHRRVYSANRLYNLVVMSMQHRPPQHDVRSPGRPDSAGDPGPPRPGRSSVKDLAAPFEMSQPAISKHLRVLERAGLIEQGRQAQWRPRRLRAEPLREIADWVGQYRRHWEESFERLDTYLRDVQEAEEHRDGDDDDRDTDRPR